MIPTRQHTTKVEYTWSSQEDVGTAKLSWTVVWKTSLLAPFTGHGTGTWQASGLPSCARNSSGKATVTWTHRQGKLIATYTFDGLP